jgi:hypothetical protein
MEAWRGGGAEAHRVVKDGRGAHKHRHKHSAAGGTAAFEDEIIIVDDDDAGDWGEGGAGDDDDDDDDDDGDMNALYVVGATRSTHSSGRVNGRTALSRDVADDTDDEVIDGGGVRPPPLHCRVDPSAWRAECERLATAGAFRRHADAYANHGGGGYGGGGYGGGGGLRDWPAHVASVRSHATTIITAVANDNTATAGAVAAATVARDGVGGSSGGVCNLLRQRAQRIGATTKRIGRAEKRLNSTDALAEARAQFASVRAREGDLVAAADAKGARVAIDAAALVLLDERLADAQLRLDDAAAAVTDYGVVAVARQQLRTLSADATALREREEMLRHLVASTHIPVSRLNRW